MHFVCHALVPDLNQGLHYMLRARRSQAWVGGRVPPQLWGTFDARPTLLCRARPLLGELKLNDQKCMVSKNNGMHPYVNARFNRNLPCSPDEKVTVRFNK